MSEPFAVKRTDWGVFIAVRRTLTDQERGHFADRFEQACMAAAAQPHWGLLVDLRGAGLVNVPPERMNRYVGMLKRAGTGRGAVLTSSWPDAARMADALVVAGMADTIRVVVLDGGDPEAATKAQRWIISGAEPRGAPQAFAGFARG